MGVSISFKCFRSPKDDRKSLDQLSLVENIVSSSLESSIMPEALLSLAYCEG